MVDLDRRRGRFIRWRLRAPRRHHRPWSCSSRSGGSFPGATSGVSHDFICLPHVRWAFRLLPATWWRPGRTCGGVLLNGSSSARMPCPPSPRLRRTTFACVRERRWAGWTGLVPPSPSRRRERVGVLRRRDGRNAHTSPCANPTTSRLIVGGVFTDGRDATAVTIRDLLLSETRCAHS
jgi:hypothetical protein